MSTKTDQRPCDSPPAAGSATRQRRDRLTESIHSIVALYEAGELTEGQATKLMNSGDRVSFRITREVVLREMKDVLAADMAAHGWKWQNAQAQVTAS